MMKRIAGPVAFLLLVGSAQGPRPASRYADVQLLIGPAFEQFAAATEALCPQAHFRFVTPADVDWEEEVFENLLPPPVRRRETQAIPRMADGTPARCANSPGGLSCPALATLDAIRNARLMGRFARFACAHKLPRHRSDDK